MYWFKTVAKLAIGALLGCFGGLALSLILMSLEKQEDTRSPGDGFLVVLCIMGGFVFGLAVSAVRVARRNQALETRPVDPMTR